MNDKRILEIKNPKMKKGQVMFVHDNLDGDIDEQYIKIAIGDGHFNDFEYGIPYGYTVEMNEKLNRKFNGGTHLDTEDFEVRMISMTTYGQNINLTKGTFYNVYLNNKHYRIKCENSINEVFTRIESGSTVNISGNCIGNLSILGLGDDSGEDFIIIDDPTYQRKGIFITFDGRYDKANIKIVEETKTIHTIPDEYIPENNSGSGAGIFTVKFTMDMATGTITADKTYSDILNEINNGRSVTGVGVMPGLASFTLPNVAFMPIDETNIVYGFFSGNLIVVGTTDGTTTYTQMPMIVSVDPNNIITVLSDL